MGAYQHEILCGKCQCYSNGEFPGAMYAIGAIYGHIACDDEMVMIEHVIITLFVSNFGRISYPWHILIAVIFYARSLCDSCAAECEILPPVSRKVRLDRRMFQICGM